MPEPYGPVMDSRPLPSSPAEKRLTASIELALGMYRSMTSMESYSMLTEACGLDETRTICESGVSAFGSCRWIMVLPS